MVDVKKSRERGVADEPDYDETDCQFLLTYVLADKLRNVITANIIIDDIIAYYETTLSLPPRGLIKQACETTLEDSPTHRLFLDYCVHSWIRIPGIPCCKRISAKAIPW